jgi:transposase-like protein
MARQSHRPEFRRRVLDLVAAGKKISDVAHDLGISEESIYIGRRQDEIDRGLRPGLSSHEHAELTAARRRICELETELAIHRRASELPKERTDPGGGSGQSTRWPDGLECVQGLLAPSLRSGDTGQAVPWGAICQIGLHTWVRMYMDMHASVTVHDTAQPSGSRSAGRKHASLL